jgi:hypothetical protein
MSKTSNFFKTSAILSTALLSLLGACAIDDPIDYTTAAQTTNSGETISERDLTSIIETAKFIGDNETLEGVPNLEPLVLQSSSKAQVVSVDAPPAASATTDIAFLVDQSGSYGDDLVTFKSLSSDIVSEFQKFSDSVKFGLTGFCDSGCGLYTLYQNLTSVETEFQTALAPLTAGGGGDGPESQLDGMYNTVEDLNWRQGSLRMIFMATDATFANPGRTYNFDQTLEKLASENVVVFGLASGSTNSDLNRVTSETGGEVYLLSSDSSGIVEKIKESVDKINNNFEIRLDPGAGGKYVNSISPSSISVTAGSTDPATFTADIDWESLVEDGYSAIKFNAYIKTEYGSYLYAQPIVLVK